MAIPSKLPTSLCIVFLLIILYNGASSTATSSYSEDTICALTPYPSFCNSSLPSNEKGDIYHYGRLFVRSSLSSSMKLVRFVSRYLQSRSKFSETTLLALQDCQLLAQLNVDFFSKTKQSINSTNSLGRSQADDLHTLLSYTLTNIETCLDGLNQTTPNPDNNLLSLLSNETKFHRISLSLIKNGWAKHRNKERTMTETKHSWEQRVFRVISGTGRKLLQSSPDNVLVSEMVVVNPDGSGNYTTVNDAVNAAPNTGSGNGFFVIHVLAGIYEEYVSIPKNKQHLMMIGDGINQTIITGNRSVVDGWTTFNSATFAVVAQGFVAVNMTFRNTAGAIKHQAVALRSGADLSAFYFCSFEGYQDTLYTHSMRQFYRNCDVFGTVDFIVGNAAVVLQDCNLYPRLPLQNQFSAITAQGRTDINQNTGTSIHNCTITAASDLAASNGTTKTYLGRPWKQYSRTVYMQAFMDNLIDPAGWTPWSGDFALDTFYYAESDNLRPGSNTTNRVTWPGYHVLTNATDVDLFTVSNFIVGDFGCLKPASLMMVAYFKIAP